MHKLVLVAGSPSHPPGLHEFRAGALLLARCLSGVPDLVVEVYDRGEIPDVVASDVSALVIYSDGGPSHPLHAGDRLAVVDGLARQGVGLGLMHYAVEIPVDRGAVEVTRWIGGFYQDGVSCNPIWEASFDGLPDHPITRGVPPFRLTDEWYFNIQFDGDGRRGTAGRGSRGSWSTRPRTWSGRDRMSGPKGRTRTSSPPAAGRRR